MEFCDLTEASAIDAITDDRGVVELKRVAADVAALEFGSTHAGTNSLNDQVAFKLSDGADDDHDGAAQGGRRYRYFPGS